MVPGEQKAAPVKDLINVGLPHGLVADMDEFLSEHPEYGIKHRNDFANRAVGDMLRALRHDVHERLKTQEMRARPGPMEKLRRSKP